MISAEAVPSTDTTRRTGEYRTGKQLYVPEKTFTSSGEFIDAYPHLKAAVAIVALADLYPPPETDFATRDKIKAYRDMILYAADPTRPAEFSFYLDKARSNLMGRPGPAACEKQVIAKFPIAYTGGLKFTFPLRDYLGGSAYGLPGADLGKYGLYLLNKAGFIDAIARHIFTNFRFRTPYRYVDFAEVYGIRDIKNVPEHTISYVITGQDVPGMEDYPGINTHDVVFWSVLFGEIPLGTAILDAAVRNMPVSIKTDVTEWKDPQFMENKIIAWETDTDFRSLIVAAFQDFKVTVGTKNNVLVEYSRGVDTMLIKNKKENGFKRIVQKVSFYGAIAVVAIAGAGAVSQIAAGGAEAATGAAAGGAEATGAAAGGAGATGAAAGGAGGGGALAAIGTGVKLASGALGLGTAYETYEAVKKAGEQAPAPMSAPGGAPANQNATYMALVAVAAILFLRG